MPAARSRAVTVASYGDAPALEDLRPARGGHVGGGEHVLERQRHPGQRRRQRLTGGDGGVDGRPRRPAPARPRRAGTRGTRSSVAAIWSRQAWVTSVDDTSLAAILAPSVAASSRISSVTRPPPGSAGRRTGRRPPSGAAASACSCVRHGSTTSGRVTLTSLSGLSVASTPVTSTAWIWPTWARMASSWPAKLSSSPSVRASRARRARWATSSREICDTTDEA